MGIISVRNLHKVFGPQGRVRQTGTPEEILSDPADDYVEAFVQNIDRTRGTTASAIIHGHATGN